nr:MAG TPA: hypothetical protein [Caudoviricetes sp.]
MIIALSIINIVLAIDSNNRFSYCLAIETKHRQLSEVSQGLSRDSVSRTARQ